MKNFRRLNWQKDLILFWNPAIPYLCPAGYWHHMEYLDSGFAMSLRAMQPSLAGKLKGVWSLSGYAQY